MSRARFIDALQELHDAIQKHEVRMNAPECEWTCILDRWTIGIRDASGAHVVGTGNPLTAALIMQEMGLFRFTIYPGRCAMEQPALAILKDLAERRHARQLAQFLGNVNGGESAN